MFVLCHCPRSRLLPTLPFVTEPSEYAHPTFLQAISMSVEKPPTLATAFSPMCFRSGDRIEKKKTKSGSDTFSFGSLFGANKGARSKKVSSDTRIGHSSRERRNSTALS